MPLREPVYIREAFDAVTRRHAHQLSVGADPGGTMERPSKSLCRNRTSVLLTVLALAAAGRGGLPGRPRRHRPEVVAAPRGTAAGVDPADAAWASAPRSTWRRSCLQDMVEPRLLAPSTREVRVRAVTDGTRVAFRLEWDDADARRPAGRPGASRTRARCSSRCASSADVPAPQMGETGRPVEITYWRASWQAVVDGRGDTIQAIYPNATVDHYPFEAASLQEGSPEQERLEQALRAGACAREHDGESRDPAGAGPRRRGTRHASTGKRRCGRRTGSPHDHRMGRGTRAPAARGAGAGDAIGGRVRRLARRERRGRRTQDAIGVGSALDGEGCMSTLATGDLDSTARSLLQRQPSGVCSDSSSNGHDRARRADVVKLAAEIEDAEVRAAAGAAEQTSEGAHSATLGPGGIASPREVGYRTFDDPGWVLADVQRYYDAFGFRPSVEDPPDHVAVETAFVGFLSLKEAYAPGGCDADGERTAREARERFIEEHLATLAAPFAARMADGGSDALTAAARALAARVPAPPALPHCSGRRRRGTAAVVFLHSIVRVRWRHEWVRVACGPLLLRLHALRLSQEPATTPIAEQALIFQPALAVGRSAIWLGRASISDLLSSRELR